MALATQTSPGEIRLAGDLGGNNNALAPELSNSGVTAGSYNIANITVDSKGRITAASSATVGDIQTFIGDATTSSKGLVQIGTNINVSSGIISVAVATNTTLGVVKSADTNNITITSGDINVGSNIPKLNAENVYSARQSTTPVNLTDGPTINVDASLGNLFTVTLGGNRTLANPTNLAPGQYTFIISQDGTGNRTLAFGSSYKFKAGSSNVLSTAPNKKDLLCCISDGTLMYCSLVKDFS